MAKEYKYNINALLDELTVAKYKTVIPALEKEGIPERTFQRDKSIAKNEMSDIPAKRLMIYAKFFEVALESLYNYDQQVKPINRRKLSELDKKVISKTGLKPPHK